MNPLFFKRPSEFRAWLEEHHEKEPELWVGFRKKASGEPSMTWSEAVDQALCFGWIDSVRRGIDDTRYANRFTPRKQRSTWSTLNVKRIKELVTKGLVRPAGLVAFEERVAGRTGKYSYEQKKSVKLDDAYEERFRANEKAWSFFQAQAAWYRRAAVWWIMSAKKTATKQSRFARLIEDSSNGRTIPPLTRPNKAA
jgi:uncharacterized protein YdeI (YjbR/CyaY-like superfamily)